MSSVFCRWLSSFTVRDIVWAILVVGVVAVDVVAVFNGALFVAGNLSELLVESGQYELQVADRISGKDLLIDVTDSASARMDVVTTSFTDSRSISASYPQEEADFGNERRSTYRWVLDLGQVLFVS